MDWHIQNWQDIGAIATGGSLLAAAAALIYTGRQLGEARKARQEQNEHAERIQEAQSRPYVVIDFDMSVASSIIELEVQNIGNSAACDVRFEFDPPLASTMDDDSFAISDADMWRLIPTLPPGRTRRALFDTAIDRTKQQETRPELVDTYRVCVSYKGEINDKQYSSTFVLDLASYKRVSKLERYGVHDLVKKVDRVDKTLNNFKRDFHALRVVTESVDERAARHRAEAAEMRRRQIVAESESHDGSSDLAK